MSLQDDLIKLTRTDEINQRLKAMENGERIKKKVGSAYENGWNGSSFDNDGNGGKDGPDSTDNGDSSQDDKDNGNDTSKKADEEINTGDDMGMGLGGLFDCDSGQCINVNFNQDYKRKPKGWEEQCKPPETGEKDGYYWVGVETYYEPKFYAYYPWKFTDDNRPPTKRNLSSCKDAESWLNEKAGDYTVKSRQIENRPEGNCKDEKISVGKVDYCNSGNDTNYFPTMHDSYSNMSGASCDFQEVSATERVVNRYKCNENSPSGTCGKDKPTKWPDSKCSEIQTNATGTSFEMACKEFDKNMPKRFTEGSFSEMELCDKDGNKVKIKRTVKGFEITQDKYGTTAIVDPSSYKVTETHKWRR